MPIIPRRICFGLSAALFCCSATAAVVPKAEQRPLYVPGQVIVKYKAGMESRLAHIAALQDVTAREERSLAGIRGLNVVDLGQGTDVMAAVKRLKASGLVEYAEPNYYRYPTATPNYTVNTSNLGPCTHGTYASSALGAPAACVYPDDPDAQPGSTNYQWQLENRGSGMQHNDVGLTAAWGLLCAPSSSTCNSGLSSPGTSTDFTVAIIDDGFDLNNPDLHGNLIPGTSCIGTSPCAATSNSAANATKTDGTEDHGTLVAGSLAGIGGNGLAIAGTTWEARILPIKTDLSDSAIINAVGYAIANGARIINESFGGPIPSQAEYDALSAAKAANILVVVSAGNSDSNNDRAGAAYPAGYAAASVIFPHLDGSGDPVPGAVTTKPGLPNVIAVAASDFNDELTPWSQWGSYSVGLLAPGDGIITLQRGASGGTIDVAGTSFSAPITAGTAALVGEYLTELQSQTPDWHDLKAHLFNGGERTQSGHSSMDGRSATGRLNAYLAMQPVSHGVIVVRGVDISGGDGNHEIDPDENADLVVTLADVGADESGVQGALSYAGSDGLASVTGGTVDLTGGMHSTGATPNVVDGTATMTFPTKFGAISGNTSLLFSLHLTTASGGDETRYFYLEAGQLQEDATVSGTLTRNAYDDFQDFHITVPDGAKNLLIWSTTEGGVDIDLLAMKDRSPQYLETIGVDSPSSDPEFQQYIEPNTQTSGRADGDESIAYDGLASPFDAVNRPATAAGTYHVVVVNFSGHSRQAYTLTACYAAPGSDEITFDGNYEYDEAAGNATLTLLRSGSTGAVSVSYASHDGGLVTGALSAKAGTNYTGSTGTVSWAAGDSTHKTITIPLANTGKIAKGSTAFLHFNVTLASPTGGVKLGCIHDADVAIGNPATVIPSSGGTSGGGGGTPTPPPPVTPPPKSGGGGGFTGLLSLLALTGALLRRRRRTGH